MNAWAHSTHHAKRQLDRCTHFHTTTQESPHWLQWDAANSPPNCPLSFSDHHQNLIHPYQARPHSPPQTASRSNQPFHHSSHVRPDRWGGRMFSNILHSARNFDRERRTNNINMQQVITDKPKRRFALFQLECCMFLVALCVRNPLAPVAQ